MLSSYSVKKRFTVLVAVALIFILGIISFLNLTTDLMPTIELPYMVIVTPYPGASPEKVESSVTRPLESSLATSSGIVNIQSVSSENVSMVILEFEPSTNMDSAMIDVSGKIDLVEGSFDDLVGTSSIMRISPDMMPIVVASIDVQDMSRQEVSTFTTDDIIPAFERLPGVASVTTTGLIETQISVTLNDEKIKDINLKVLASIDKELAEAQQELYDAQAEIEDGLNEIEIGKNELEQGKNEITASLASGSVEIDAAIAQISALISEGAALEANEAAFIGEKEGLIQIYLALNGFEPGGTLSPTAPGAIGAISATLASTGTLPPTITPPGPMTTTELLALSDTDFEAYLQAVSMLSSIPSLPIPAESIAMITELTKEDVELIENAPARITEINAELNNITTRKAVIAIMLPELEASLEEMKSMSQELESGKMDSVNEFTKGEVTLESAQAELEAAKQQIESSQEEMDEAKQNALEQADITSFLTQDIISSIIMAENFNLPAGYISDGDNEYLIKIGEEFKDIDELRNTVIFYADIDGVGEVELGDIATVEFTDNSADSYAKVNNNNSVILNFQKQSTASTAQVSDEIAGAMRELEIQYENVHFSALMDQGEYIDIVIQSVLSNLMYGGILAIIVLALFLKDFRPTAIVAASIPFSLLCAITAMYFTNITLNIISLSGLSLGVGMLVDNSIVVIENIYRLRSDGMPPAKAAVKGAKQVSGAIFASTLTTVCVFLPIVFTEGLSRDLFSDMGLTIAYSLLASLFVALTLVPALGATVLKNNTAKQQKWFNSFIKFYERALSTTLNNKAPVLIFVIILLAFSIYQVTQVGTAFIPAMESPQMSATLTMSEEATQQEIYETSDEVIKRIYEIEGIETVGITIDSNSSTSMLSGSTSGVQIYILLEDGTDLTNASAAQQIQDSVIGLNCEIDVQESTMDMSALGGSGIELVIKGSDLDVLAQIADDLRNMLSETEGTTEISVAEQAGEEVRIIVDKNAAMRHSLTVAQIQAEISSSLTQTKQSTTITIEDKNYPVIVVRDESQMPNITNIMDYEFEVTDAQGEKSTVELNEIAGSMNADSVQSVNRENGSRYLTVTSAIEQGYNIGLVSRDLQTTLDEYETPAGYTIDFVGENESINTAINDLILVIILAVAFVYLIMVAQFQSLLSPFIVMFTIPLAFTGGLIAMLITNRELSIVSMLGFLVLVGIVVNNGIVFVDSINQLRLEGMNRRQAILRTGKIRIRPVLMTTLTTVLAMTTMALGIGQGAEMTQDLAIVTIGGLLYATLLTLFVVPILYDIMRKKEMKNIEVD